MSFVAKKIRHRKLKYHCSRRIFKGKTLENPSACVFVNMYVSCLPTQSFIYNTSGTSLDDRRDLREPTI